MNYADNLYARRKFMKLLKVFLWSMVPIIEQKGSIILGIVTFKLNPYVVFLVTLIGSFVPVPFILIFFNSIFKWMKKIKMLNGLNKFIENKIQKNSGKMVKYKEIALITFIGIPLPTTGLWTGSAIAAFLGLDFKKSMLCAAIGGIISGFLITVMVLVFPSLLGIG